MYLTQLKGNHYQIGVKRGISFQQENLSFPLQLDAFQRRHGEASEKQLREYFPEVCEEIKGVTDTIRVDYLSFASWLLCMGCCLYNLEQNLPVEVRGCTAFAYEKAGRIIYGRNNDLPPYLRESSKSELYQIEPELAYASCKEKKEATSCAGRRFNITTSSFINGEEGLNEHGLTVAMTFVMTCLERIQPGFNACFLVRYLLEKADCTQRAISLLMDLPIASNCNLLFADKSGEMAVVECAPSRKKVRYAETFANGRLICAVNRFISEEMLPYDDTNGEDYDSLKRYQVVFKSFQKYFKNDSIEATKQLLRGEYGFMCQYDNEPDFETVWSSIFDLETLKIYRTEGDPRNHSFLTDCRLQELVQKRTSVR